MKRAVSTALLLSMICVVNASCTESPKSGSVEVQASTEPDGADSPARTSASDFSSWITVREWTRDDTSAAFGTANRKHVLLLDQIGDPTSIRAEGAKSGKQLWRHVAEPGDWQVQAGWLTKDVAVGLDTDGVSSRARLYAYDLRQGESIRLPNNGRAGGPEADVSRGNLAFISGNIRSGLCVRVLDLRAGKSKYRKCLQPNVIVGDVAMTGTALTYTVLTNWKSKTNRCKEVVFADVSAGRKLAGPSDMASTAARCQAWSGMTMPGVYAWDEANPFDEDFYIANAFALVEDSVVELGEIDTDSMVACGDAMYWQLSSGSTQIMRWVPGQEVTSLVIPEKDKVATALQCTDDRWLSTRVDDTSGKDERLTLMMLDTRAG